MLILKIKLSKYSIPFVCVFYQFSITTFPFQLTLLNFNYSTLIFTFALPFQTNTEGLEQRLLELLRNEDFKEEPSIQNLHKLMVCFFSFSIEVFNKHLFG